MADPMPTPAVADSPFAQTAPTPEGLIASLRPRAVGDPHLLAYASATEVEYALERTVRAVWESSRVKVFVPVFALRALREELVASALPDPSALATDRRRPAVMI
jgi:hypothetical protein